ncbi:MAG: hypothetical protein EOM20_13420 [Spartobacteria bacterium]|nr:hypothetical protein [Spartobacteria bacterium]
MNEMTNESGEAEVWSAISSFEQILEAMPNDRVALETLHEAYEKIGDQAQALNYLSRLAMVVCEERDVNAGAALLEKFEDHMDSDLATVQEAILHLQGLVSGDLKEEEPEQPVVRAKPKRRPTDITRELSLAWELLQSEQISQENYETIVQDLTESSTRNIESPITVLHVVEDRQFTNGARILAHMARITNIPIVMLSKFDIDPEALTMLPIEVVSKHGAMVFDFIKNEALVAILNPFDTELQDEIKAMLNRPCHFYLTSAAEYDGGLNQIRQRFKEEAEDKRH